MTRLKENKARERRIEMEVVVDAYNALERAMGWYYYLEERLKFPFKASTPPRIKKNTDKTVEALSAPRTRG
ncbi:MAG: calcium-binding protein [Betaproteobacteria bacterium]